MSVFFCIWPRLACIDVSTPSGCCCDARDGIDTGKLASYSITREQLHEEMSTSLQGLHVNRRCDACSKSHSATPGMHVSYRMCGTLQKAFALMSGMVLRDLRIQQDAEGGKPDQEAAGLQTAENNSPESPKPYNPSLHVEVQPFKVSSLEALAKSRSAASKDCSAQGPCQADLESQSHVRALCKASGRSVGQCKGLGLGPRAWERS